MSEFAIAVRLTGATATGLVEKSELLFAVALFPENHRTAIRAANTAPPKINQDLFRIDINPSISPSE